MDELDYTILSCLKDNARMTSSEISKKINLSVSAVIERIKKLETSGIIEKYTVTLNQKKLGNDRVAIMEVSLEHPKYYDAFVDMVSKNPNIQSCYYLTGEFDFVLKIITDSTESLNQIHRRIKSLKGVQATETHFVLKSLKCDPSVIPTLDYDYGDCTD